MRLPPVLLFFWLNLTPALAVAASLNIVCLRTQLTILTANTSGRVGICVFDGKNGASVNGDRSFPLFSVSEVPVAVAVLDAVDRGKLRLDDVVTISSNNASAGAQPATKTADHIDSRTTIQDLLIRMIADDNGVATDLLITKLGGPRAVQNVLIEKELQGFNIDRDERDPRSFGSHHHNTATPIAVANLLQWLVNGRLLSQRSSSLLLETMVKARSFPDRLEAGLPAGWLLAHKTGTGITSRGISDAINDAGILMAPDNSGFVVAVVLISKSRSSDHDQAALIAKVARAIETCRQ